MIRMKYNDLEMSILSCMLLNPSLMENNNLEDKYFKNHIKVWRFMKAFYSKFHTFDITLMYSVAKNQYNLMMYVEHLLDVEPTTANFELYQQQLINLYNEDQKEKYIIDKVYAEANNLLVRGINSIEFVQRIKQIYKQAEHLYGGENETN